VGRRHRRVAALCLIVPLVPVSACGSDDQGGAGAKAPIAAKGPVLDGSRYRVTLPDGWKDATEESRRRGFTLPDGGRMLAGEVIDGYAVNVIVIREQVPPGMSLEEYAEAGRQLLKDREAFERMGMDPGELGPPWHGSLDGAPAIIQELSNTIEGKELRVRVLVTLRGTTAYTVSFYAPKDHFQGHISEFEALLDSWRWRRA
jgi:hypothetical protein